MNSSLKIPGQTGYLVLHENGATISSSGDLENDERTAEILYNLISVADKLDCTQYLKGGFNKISICFKDFCYIMCMSNKKIYIVKKKLDMLNITNNESTLIDFQSTINNEDLSA